VAYVIQIEGEYLIEYDPDGDRPVGAYPTGRLITILDPSKAKRFPTFADAFAALKAQSTVTPLRPDGKPNRPLTALDVMIIKEKDG
jgi:hypothetical protein